MKKDERDLLDVLKFELTFLEKGGYGRSPREPWRPTFIFEDSPTCMNYDSKDHPDPCTECVLMPLVPAAFRDSEIPCRHIPFNVEGETLDSLYRYANQPDIEDVYGKWLRAIVARIEEGRSAQGGPSELAVLGEGGGRGEPLFQSLHPKCANPACPTDFHWLAGGKFFRFQPETAAEQAKQAAEQSSTSNLAAKHYWLCERCAHVFSLSYDDEKGVVLKLLWPGGDAEESAKHLAAK